MDPLSLALSITSLVVGVGSVVFSVVFYRWGDKAATNASSSLKAMEVQVVVLAKEIESFRTASMEERVALTNRVLDMTRMAQFPEQPHIRVIPVVKRTELEAPLQRALPASSPGVKRNASDVSQLTDDALLTLIGLHSLQLHFRTVEPGVLRHWTALEDHRFSEALDLLQSSGFVIRDDRTLTIRPEWNDLLSDLFYVDRFYDASPSSILHQVRDRILAVMKKG